MLQRVDNASVEKELESSGPNEEKKINEMEKSENKSLPFFDA